MITAPASRSLAVSDLEQSMQFYGMLGFGAARRSDHQAELTCGPATIVLAVADTAPDSTFREQPRGHAALFLVVNDLDALHGQLAAAGLAPSSVERVNWIKYRMFEVRDPDGHVVWLAQTFQEPGLDRADPQLRKIMPTFPLSNVARGIEYYVRVLGFTINYAQHDLGVMERDLATILLVPRDPRHNGVAACFLYIRDADALHAELTERGAELRGAPVTRPWGMREFTAVDLEGNELTFAQTFE